MYENEATVPGQSRPAASLVVRQGPQAGMSFPIRGNQAIIGREEGVEVILQDPESSRRHSRVSWQGGQFVVEDLGSTNGTFVNGVQITSPRVVNSGDTIGIGQTALVFQVAGAPAPQPGQSGYTAAPAAAPSPSNQQMTNLLQYFLVGCGCLFLMCICSLSGVVAWALLDPDSFQDITTLDTGLSMVLVYLRLFG